MASEAPSVRETVQEFFALERDVLVLSVAMFAFSLGFQMTGRYLPRYMTFLGAGGVAVGLYGSVGNLVGAVYPYPSGALSDRIGSRFALTLFGLCSTLGFLVWLVAPLFGVVTLDVGAVGPLDVGELVLPVGVFLGLFLAQAWKSFGLGATFAIVKQSVDPGRLATGFASTETVRRLAFLLGPLLAAALIAAFRFEAGFRLVLAVAAAYYLVRNTVTIPSALVGGWLYDAVTPELAFTAASAVGLVGVAVFLAFGREFEAYAR